MKKISILSIALLFLLSSCNGNILNKYGSYKDYNKYHIIGKDGESFKDVKSLDIDWVRGSINIYSSNKYQNISIFEKTNEIINDDFKCHLYQDGKTLRVKYSKSSISIPTAYSKTLDVYIPYSLSLSYLTINNVSSAITIENIDCKELDVDNVSGKVNIKSLTCTSIEYNGVSGNLNMNILDVTESVEISQVSGNTILAIPESTKGFGLEYESVSGDLNLEFECNKKEDEYIYNIKENCEIDFSSVSGNLTVAKTK